jgi:hypothetical protein
VGSIRSPAACRGWLSATGHSFRNMPTIIGFAITRVGKGAKHRAHAVHFRVFGPRGLRFAAPTLQGRTKEIRKRNAGRRRVSSAPARAGRATKRAACAAPSLRARSPAGVPPRLLPKGVVVPKAQPGPGFVGAMTSAPSSSEAPRAPVIVPAGLMPGPPGNGVQVRPRAPPSPRPCGVPPRGVLTSELDSHISNHNGDDVKAYDTK